MSEVNLTLCLISYQTYHKRIKNNNKFSFYIQEKALNINFNLTRTHRARNRFLLTLTAINRLPISQSGHKAA